MLQLIKKKININIMRKLKKPALFAPNNWSLYYKPYQLHAGNFNSCIFLVYSSAMYLQTGA
jgi:hypothetical protein